jgi:hypothetical protein
MRTDCLQTRIGGKCAVRGLVACARIVCRRGWCHAFDHGLKGVWVFDLKCGFKEWAEGWARNGWMGGGGLKEWVQGGSAHRFMKLMKSKKGGNFRCLLLRRKNIFFTYIFDFTWGKIKTVHYSLLGYTCAYGCTSVCVYECARVYVLTYKRELCGNTMTAIIRASMEAGRIMPSPPQPRQ